MTELPHKVPAAIAADLAKAEALGVPGPGTALYLRASKAALEHLAAVEASTRATHAERMRNAYAERKRISARIRLPGR